MPPLPLAKTTTTAVTAVEPIYEDDSFDCDDDNLPTIRLSSGAQQVEDVYAINANDLELGDASGLVVAEQIAMTLRDPDLEGLSLRRLQKYNHKPAEFKSANFLKESTRTFLGLKLGKSRDKTVVAISNRGPMANSPIQVGDVLWSVNGKHCSAMMSKDVCRMLKNLIGSVTLVAHHEGGSCDVVESMISKERPDCKIGVGLQRRPSGKFYISHINRGSDIGSSLLSIGDEILSINGISVEHLTIDEAKDIIRFAETSVSIKAITLRETGVVLGDDLPIEDPTPRPPTSINNTTTTIAAQTTTRAQHRQQSTRRVNTVTFRNSDQRSKRCLLRFFGVAIFCTFVPIFVLVIFAGYQWVFDEDDF